VARPPVEKSVEKPVEKTVQKPADKPALALEPAEAEDKKEEPNPLACVVEVEEAEHNELAKELPARRKVRPLPKPVAVLGTINVEDSVEAAGAESLAAPKPGPHEVNDQKATPPVSQAKRPGPRLPQPKVSEMKTSAPANERPEKAKAKKPIAAGFDWTRLAKIDSILLGCESNFFINRQGDGSRIPGLEPAEAESSSEDEEDDMDESEESEQESDAAADPAKILNAGASPEDYEEEEEEEEQEDDMEVELDQDVEKEEAAKAAAVVTTRPKAKAAPPEVTSPISTAKATRPKPAPAPPPLHRRPREAKGQEPQDGKREENAPEEDEDFNDEEMMATFAARLQEPSAHTDEPGEGSPTAQDKPGPANIATRAKAKPKPKAWGAPPPLSGKKKDADRPPDAEGDDASVKAEEVPEKDQPPPPFFDQWLASLKFIAGWNDQKKYEADQVEESFSQYLATEDIVSKHTVKQLCRTIVPLLSDLERVDSMVVANLRKEVLRTLKIVQVCILRIVTFELLREHSAKVVKKGKGKKQAASEIPPEGATYLASDITSLAKVIQHFRFDQTFTKGVHQLIVSIRRQKAEKPEKSKSDRGLASRKRQGAATGDEEIVQEAEEAEVEEAEEPEEAEEAEEAAEAAQLSENNEDQEQPMQDEIDEAEDQPPKKKPRIVS